MKKETFLKILYICLSIMLIAITISWCITGLNYVVEEVKAEEIGENAILNFNQQFQYIGRPQAVGINFIVENNTIHAYGTATSTGNYYLNGATNFFNLIANHKYYININSSDSSKIVGLVFSGGSQYGYSEGNYTTLLTFSSNQAMASYLYLSNGNYYDTYITCNVVDLSQMFGIGNEPTTVDAVKQYLPLNYYAYTLGTPVSISYLGAYNQGILDTIGSYDYTVLSPSLIKSSTAINYEGKTSSIEFLFDSGVNVLSFNGCVQIPLGVTIEKGEHITFKSNIILMPNGLFSIGYLHNGFYVPLINEFDMGNINVDIVAQQDLSTLMLMCNSSENSYTPASCTLVFPEITLKLNNFEKLNLIAFENGVKSVDTQQYYDLGFEDGKQWHINHDTSNAWGSSWDFITNSFNGVGEILSIEVLPNIPIWTFIAIPLLFSVLALIYKLIGG